MAVLFHDDELKIILKAKLPVVPLHIFFAIQKSSGFHVNFKEYLKIG